MVDRDLRLGLSALHRGIVGSDQLCEALEELARRGDSSLSTILMDRGWASASQLAELERRAAEESTEGRDGTDERGTDVLDGSAGNPMSTIEHRSGERRPPPTREGGPTDDPKAGGRYEQLRVHATGGLGRVWLALDHHLGREVALKELRPDRRDDPRMLGRFLEKRGSPAGSSIPGSSRSMT